MIFRCLSCGCDKPSDTHGDRRHITLQDLQKAAEAEGISPEKAAQNIMQTLRHMVEGHGRKEA